MTDRLASIEMQQQIDSTACWISVARYCLDFLEMPIFSLEALVDRHRMVKAGETNKMTGSGKVEDVIAKETAKTDRPYICRSVPNRPSGAPKPTRKLNQAEIDSVANAIESGSPIICELRSHQIPIFKHAIVLCAVETLGDGTVNFGYKDAARKNGGANVVRLIPAAQLFDTGFVYAPNYVDKETNEKMVVYAYSRRAIYLDKVSQR
jgi:hypothetical protein